MYREIIKSSIAFFRWIYPDHSIRQREARCWGRGGVQAADELSDGGGLQNPGSDRPPVGRDHQIDHVTISIFTSSSKYVECDKIKICI